MSARDARESRLAAAHGEVKAEIARVDTKTSLLLAFIAAVFAGVWTVGSSVPLTAPARVLGGSGIGLLVVAVALLLRSVRPNLRGGGGFPLWATLTAEEIRATLGCDQAAEVADLSRIAVGKFTAFARAVDLTRTAAALLFGAALATLGGAA
ncbi:Pycsar system effector family protein [Streptomyces sp. MAR4 CNX-425]|uniref:Pycsar system effector family protein n=1 Tax=Streptomyces sp. MAR4 CNX-425 TaxID=3406343 RepID=UPI003B511B5E